MLRKRIMPVVGSLVLACSVFWASGCDSSSHKSVRTYEYSNEPVREDPYTRQKSDELDSEYKMVSPGEMVAPGRMVDE